MKNKKVLIYALVVSAAIVCVSAVFLPSLFKMGNIGTYRPVGESTTSFYTRIDVKMNNKAILNYRDGIVKEVTWYAKNDSKYTSLYFKVDNSDIQFVVLEGHQIKDIYHNNDIYSKK